MKQVIFLAPLLLSLLAVPASASQKATGANKVKNEQSHRPKLGTSFKFDGSALRGKYQSSLNTKATVENDKLLEDLLGGRNRFDDKIDQDEKRN